MTFFKHVRYRTPATTVGAIAFRDNDSTPNEVDYNTSRPHQLKFVPPKFRMVKISALSAR